MKVIFPDAKKMEDLGYAKLAYVPFLIGADGDYPVEANRYLRERACLEWRPSIPGKQGSYRFNTRQTVASLDAMARRLMEFLLWCNNSTPLICWKDVVYLDDLIDKWQVGMLSGSASRSRKKLAVETINARVAEACYFLSWAAERGYREAFYVMASKVGLHDRSSKRGGNGKASRAGELVSRRRSLSLPSDVVLARWHSNLKIRYGVVLALFAEFLMRTGLRISEGTKFRVQDLPEREYGPEKNGWREDWLQSGEIPCTICMGVKGPKIARGSAESSRPRVIYIPIELADRMNHYRQEGRSTLISRWVSAGKSKDERDKRLKSKKTDAFWLGKRGKPLSNSWVRQAWSSGATTPWRWCPHMARHLFAVNTLVNYMRDLISQFRFSTIPSVGWLHGLMAGQISIILTPLMGHMSEETTLLYLKAAKERLMMEFQHPTLRWLDDCDSR
ncbi:hypothetical protein [Pseudomonas sp. CCNWLW23]|uniref:hypothetical protein n=1 Tax=Pseudomonas sp. CCNWLW23 TaxID=3126385 RepID=UPI003012A5A0